MFLHWLPDALRDAGGDVYVMPGAETRSTWDEGLVSVVGVVWHHTATSTSWLDGHVAALLRDGRRDLTGPLAQIGVERDGTIVIVALGRANHNGYGEWGNYSVGIEFYNAGDGEPLTPAQVAAGLLITTVVLKHEGLPGSKTEGHREQDPTRKIDLLPEVLDMDEIRAEVTRRLEAPPAPAPKPSKVSTVIFQVTDIEPDGYFFVMPDGPVRLDDQQAFRLVMAGTPILKMILADFKHLVSGPRYASFND